MSVEYYVENPNFEYKYLTKYKYKQSAIIHALRFHLYEDENNNYIITDNKGKLIKNAEEFFDIENMSFYLFIYTKLIGEPEYILYRVIDIDNSSHMKILNDLYMSEYNGNILLRKVYTCDMVTITESGCKYEPNTHFIYHDEI